jgi:propionate CoA-transferase
MPARMKITTADEAIAAIRDGDTVCVSGFVGVGTPEELIRALERRFEKYGHPRDLTLVFAAAPGDGANRGLNRLAKPGLVKCCIGGHWALVPKLAAMATANQIEAYNLPLGCISQLFREIAGRKPGMLTRVGLHTFVDPRQTGGRINEKTMRELVALHTIDGKEWLFYKSFPNDVVFLRATTADPDGNATMEREALTLDALSMAMATKASKGKVILQVERIAARGSLKPRQVALPGVLVDCIVQSRPENHHQTFATGYAHAFSGELRVPQDRIDPMTLDERKIIARRAALELPLYGVANLGIGMPEGIARIAQEEGLLDNVTLTAEPGVIGGIPRGGLDFGAVLNADAIIQQNQQFDFYDGGGLDMACLGMAQADANGNVNVSRFGPRLAGAGGFINISQSAATVVFVGTFTAQGLKVSIDDGRLRIVSEGRTPKFIKAVEQITFNGRYAFESGQRVLYVTERRVFTLTDRGLELIEVAPGIDIDRDILGQMQFEPIIENPSLMDARLFAPGRLNIPHALMAASASNTPIPLSKRALP